MNIISYKINFNMNHKQFGNAFLFTNNNKYGYLWKYSAN